jgi:hypothetical protein
MLVRLQVCGQCMTVWAFLSGGGHVLGLFHVPEPPRIKGSASPPWHEPDAPSTLAEPARRRASAGSDPRARPPSTTVARTMWNTKGYRRSHALRGGSTMLNRSLDHPEPDRSRRRTDVLAQCRAGKCRRCRAGPIRWPCPSRWCRRRPRLRPRRVRPDQPWAGEQRAAGSGSAGSGSARAGGAARAGSRVTGVGGPDSAGDHSSAVEPLPHADIPDADHDGHNADHDHHVVTSSRRRSL